MSLIYCSLLQNHWLLWFHEESKEGSQGAYPQELMKAMYCLLLSLRIPDLILDTSLQTSSRQDDRQDTLFNSYRDPAEDSIGPEGDQKIQVHCIKDVLFVSEYYVQVKSAQHQAYGFRGREAVQRSAGGSCRPQGTMC